jgi:flagellar hook-associated protein 1 FlgK
MSDGNMSLGAFYNSLVGKVGVAVQNAERNASLSEGVIKQLDNLRESNAGVSLDEELANLIKYQKAFEGAAKLINTGQEMMDTILGLVR